MIDREEFERLRAACSFLRRPISAVPLPMHSEAQLAIFTTGWCAVRKSIRCTAVTTGSAAIPSAGNWSWKRWTPPPIYIPNLPISFWLKTAKSSRLEDAAYQPIVDSRRTLTRFRKAFSCTAAASTRRQMDTVLGKMLDDMEAVKVQSRGGMYFVPRQHMGKNQYF